MPLTEFQRNILLLLAKNRNPDSYIAGGIVLNQTKETHPEDLKKARENLRRWSRTTSKHAAPYLLEWKNSFAVEKYRFQSVD